MKQISKGELEKILVKHKHWLNRDVSGWKNLRADLRDCDLSGMVLNSCDLISASLISASLISASLISANLNGANLNGANLRDTKLTGAKGSLIEYRKGKVLTEDIVGYKKCLENRIVTLKIPKGAIVFSINGRKCRTNRAIVTDVKGTDEALSIYDEHRLRYYKGAEFYIEDFNLEYNMECTTGIHFFMTREEAEAY